MKIIKKINNNCAMAEDGNGRILVAFGKGIGFPEMPYELNDLSKIDRTFYDAKEEHIPLFKEADEKVVSLSMELLDYIRAHVNKDISDFLYYVLVDHINFSIQRYKNNVYVPMNLARDIKFNYQDEYNAALECWKIINHRMGINLPKDEASIIAMHIVESEEVSVRSQREIDINQIVDDVMQLIKKETGIDIDDGDFNVYRFETHLRYLIQRMQQNDFEQVGEEMYEIVREKYPEADSLAEKTSDILQKALNIKVTDSEKLYLMMHINRLSEKKN